MKYISNRGKAKQVKYTSGVIMNIPEGSTSLPDDSNLDKMVGSSPDLSYITQGEFFKQNNITPTKEKIEAAKKEKPKMEPPKKSRNKQVEDKKEEAVEKIEESKTEEKTEELKVD